jgi:hypothetical protein
MTWVPTPSRCHQIDDNAVNWRLGVSSTWSAVFSWLSAKYEWKPHGNTQLLSWQAGYGYINILSGHYQCSRPCSGCRWWCGVCTPVFRPLSTMWRTHSYLSLLSVMHSVHSHIPARPRSMMWSTEPSSGRYQRALTAIVYPSLHVHALTAIFWSSSMR